MSEYILYGGQFTRAVITEMVLTEGQIPYRLEPVDVINNQHLSAEYLSINPAGLVPTLVTPSGQTIAETAAINLYLIDRIPISHLGPATNHIDRGKFLNGLFYLTGEFEPAMKRFFFPHRYAVDPQQIAEVKQMAFDDALRRLTVIESGLIESPPYYLGDDISLVDLTLAYWIASIGPDKIRPDFPGIAKLFDRVKARPRLSQFFVELENARVNYAERHAGPRGVG